MRVDLVNLHGSGPGAAPSLLSEWRVGAILQAIAVRDPRTGQLALDIGGQRHPARLASGDGAGPQNGEHMQLRVLRNSPVLALETIATSPRPAADSNVVGDALLKFVPRQESPTLMLANLAWLAQGKNGTATLPRTVLHAAMRLWQAIPEAGTLGDADALEAAIARSGTFLETNLAAGRGAARTDIAGDLKGLMLSLSRALQEHGARAASARADTAVHSPIPSARGPLTTLPAAPATFALVDTPAQQLNELSRQTEGALARLTTNQISNSAADTPVQSLMIELPVRHDDRAAALRLRIERDGSRRQQGGSDMWTVEAAIDLGLVGALHAKVTLTGQRIGVQLRAESPAIVDALSTRAAELESMLREAGLDIDRIVCLHGMPAGDVGARAARLLDVRA
jgi:Flagellar hook-length control protein FliK